MSKFPFVVAQDQGLYEKYGLNVELYTGPPPFYSLRVARANFWKRVGRRLGILNRPVPDIRVDGATPSIIQFTIEPDGPDLVSIASTDCVVRSHIVGRHGIDSLEELKGKRLGVSNLGSTSGFVARSVAERMGWDLVKDITIVPGSDEIDDLSNDVVDATVAYEMQYARAMQEGLPILADTRTWNDYIAGNSVRVERAWLTDPTNREIARRFLMALAEAVALVHQNRELSLHVLDDWYGIKDQEFAERVLARGAWIPRELYPCYEGTIRTMELYDSVEMRKYEPEYFYDDSIMRDIVASGFIDELYE